MRHINFDESSVLQEFAKIAKQKGMVKEAAKTEQYDVSGETGEQLVDKAHPEGSPKVEGVKTTDVVETIVDQQKKDIEVVNKKPTGKYAEFVAELVALADELDAEGLTTFASQIDELIKKADEITGKLPVTPVGSPMAQAAQRLRNDYPKLRESKPFITAKFEFIKMVDKFAEEYKEHPEVKNTDIVNKLKKLPDEYEAMLPKK